MSSTQDAWKEVASRAEGLGLKLKLHLDQENDETTDKQPGETESAVNEFSQRMQDAFEAFGRAAKDPAVHADVKDMGGSFLNAMTLTFHSVGAKVSAAARDISASAADAASDATASASDAAAGVQDAATDASSNPTDAEGESA